MDIFSRILAIILPVFCVIGIGYGYARLRRDNIKSDMTAVNRVTMEALAPLLIFSALAAKDFSLVDNSLLILAGVVISLGSGLLAWPFARLMGYEARTFVPPMIYNNSGNMGLPLAVLAFGPAGLSPAVALFMASSVVFFSVGVKIVETGRHGRKSSLLKFFTSPMMLATIVGVAFSLLGIHLPEPLFAGLKLVGEASIPLMLFALGVRMLDIRFDSWRIGLVGAVFCPLSGLVLALLLDALLSFSPEQRGQMYLFSVLPPAVFCFMLAEQYQQEPDKVAAIVLIGNLAALVFVPFGLWLGLR